MFTGYSLSRRVLTSIVRRYGGKDKKLAFDDFVVAITKVVVNLGKTLQLCYTFMVHLLDYLIFTDVFSKHSKDKGLSGKAKFTLEEVTITTLYVKTVTSSTCVHVYICT